MKPLHEIFIQIASTALALGCAAGAAFAEGPVRITADRVNMRAKPGFENSEVLGQLAYDQRLDVLRTEGEWVGIVPPSVLGLWIRGDYVDPADSTVTASRLNVRAGPSVNYTVVANLDRGTRVEVRRELDGWLEIAPPPGICVWVHKDYVEPLPPADVPETAAAPKPRPASKPKAPPRAHPAPETTPAKTDVPAPAAPPPAAPAALPAPLPLPPDTTTNALALAKPPRRARNPHYTRPADTPATSVPVPDLVALPPAAAPTPIVAPSAPAAAAPSPLPASFKLVPLDGQGKTATHEGVLRAAPLFNDGPTRYRILVWQDNRWQIQCHVFGEAVKFRALQDKTVRVRGREYWVQDTSAPVLVPEQIQELVPQQEN